MKKFIILGLIALISLTTFAGTLAIKGSNTVFPIAQLWVEELGKINPELNITLEGAGSTTGITGLFNETADIANTSRWMKDKEFTKMHEEGKYFLPFVLAYDGIAIVVNNTLGIDEISIETLRDIYTGKIKTWNQIDSNLPKKEIVFYTRNTASGTYETFSELVLAGEKMDPRARMVESTQFEIDTVSINPYAIAYVGVGYVSEKIKVLKLNGVLPTKSNILTGNYPLSRPLFMWINATEGFPKSGEIKEYLTFGFSKLGQELVEKAGFVSAYGQ